MTVCERWLHSFANFLADMGEKPQGLTLDRIERTGNYEPTNCRWATGREQARNRRNNRLITFNGETLSLKEWSERVGIHIHSLAERLEKWPLEKALNTPKQT